MQYNIIYYVYSNDNNMTITIPMFLKCVFIGGPCSSYAQKSNPELNNIIYPQRP